MSYPLLTPRLSIAPLSEADLESFVEYRQDPQIAQYQSWDETYSRKQAAELIASQAGVESPSAGNWLQLGIHDRDSGELLGDLALHSFDAEASTFEIGFTLRKEHQGKGVAFEAANRLLQFLFEEKMAAAVCASSDSRNNASIKLLVALGFKQQPEKGWTEMFKGELVSVEYFELSRKGWKHYREQV